MTLPCRVPLTQLEQEVIASMPKTRAGHVVHPDHVPHEQLPAYRAQLGEWARRTPRSHWPAWFADYVDRERVRSPGGTPPAELGAGDRRDDLSGRAAGEG